MATTPARPVRILCLHGFGQNAIQFQGKTAALKRSLKSIAELAYVQGPHRLMPLSAPPGAELDEVPVICAWWRYQEVSGIYQGWQESVELIREHCRQEGPYDGVLGFSQGACMASVLMSLPPPSLFRFAIICGGFKSRDPELLAMMENSRPICAPSLHIIGDDDKVTKADMSGALVECFERPELYRHAGGHYLPSDAIATAAYRQFIKGQLPSDGGNFNAAL